MLGAFKARVAPFNVNYRYVAEELRYLLNDSRRIGDRRAQPVRPDAGRRAPRPRQPARDHPGARRLRQRPAAGRRVVRGRAGAASPDKPAVEWSPDDLYILYTGGTTGMPKGVLWRNGDANVECFGGSEARHARRGRRRGRRRAEGAARAAVHARRRALDELPHVEPRRHRLRAVDTRTPRPGRRVGSRRARAAQLPADRRRRVRPAAARRARAPRRTTCRRSPCCCPAVRR